MSTGTVAIRTIAWNRVASIVAWLGGTFTTYLFFATALPELAWYASFTLAGLVQWLLTMGERPLWRRLLGRRGGQAAPLAFVVTIGDGLLNAAGIYPFVGQLAKTGLGAMLAEVLHVERAMDPLAAFGVAFLLGLIVAALPEFLWESG